MGRTEVEVPDEFPAQEVTKPGQEQADHHEGDKGEMDDQYEVRKHPVGTGGCHLLSAPAIGQSWFSLHGYPRGRAEIT